MNNDFIIKNKIDDTEVVFEVVSSKEDKQYTTDDIELNIKALDEKLNTNQGKLDTAKKEYDDLSVHADKLDYLVAVCSGLVSGIIDVIISTKNNIASSASWGKEAVNDAVIAIAKSRGYKGNTLSGAVTKLEEFHIAADDVEASFGGGLQHHLRDFSHHLSPSGLMFSVLTQFTGQVYGTDTNGKFISVPVTEKGSQYIGDTFSNKIFFGVSQWLFHMASDVAGSSNSTRAGTAGSGLPGPILSFIKLLSASPIFSKGNEERRANISREITRIFNGTEKSIVKEDGVPIKFDFRTELGLAHRQALLSIPILINSVVVRTFYFIRRLIDEIKNNESVWNIDWKKVLPFNNATITRMMVVSSGTLTAMDLVASAIKSAIASKGNPYAFLANLVLRINYGALISFSCSLGKEIQFAYLRNKKINEIIELNSERMTLMNAKTYYLLNDTWNVLEETEKSIKEVSILIENVTKLLIETSRLNDIDMKKIGSYKEGIDKNNPDLNDEILDILDW